ncbi:hypothetical protein DSL72_002325 [Monilinia vaccinii-corymbosi]|uniref:Cysteine-rich transmembrane CYSTM domain-containing protein n=1 Tax=Monilinia vaccinii-corymbosi TaxID=61207 RepID=A0A8A3PCB6_9HELO|nr:hypothetical protein DSL72_002325 [Monilinia vaccinii-corymbosi]
MSNQGYYNPNQPPYGGQPQYPPNAYGGPPPPGQYQQGPPPAPNAVREAAKIITFTAPTCATLPT